MRRAVFASAIALLACAEELRGDAPTFPTTLHLAEGLPWRDEDVFIQAAARWDEARGQAPMFSSVERGGDSCGVYVEPTASYGFPTETAGGMSTIFANCKWRVRLSTRVAPERRLLVAMHELGHALAGNGSHNPDKASVMHGSAGTEILPEDVELSNRAVDDY